MNSQVGVGAVLLVAGIGTAAYYIEKNQFQLSQDIKSEVFEHQSKDLKLNNEISLQSQKVIGTIANNCKLQFDRCFESTILSESCQYRMTVDHEGFDRLHKPSGTDPSFSPAAELCYIELGHVKEKCQEEEINCLKK